MLYTLSCCREWEVWKQTNKKVFALLNLTILKGFHAIYSKESHKYELALRQRLLFFRHPKWNADIGNGLVNTVGEEKSETKGKSSIGIYTLPYSWWEVVIQHREPSLAICDDLEGWGEGMGRGLKWMRRSICIAIVELHCCTAGTNTSL